MAILGAGRHDVTVTRTGLNVASTGNAQLVVQFADAQGNTITAYLATTEAAWPYTEEKLRALGWDPHANGYRFEELNLEPSPLVGRAAEITVQDEEYNGKVTPKVAFINPPGGLVERMTAEEATAFAAKLRARLLGSGAPPPPPTRPAAARPARTQPAPAQRPATEDDDDSDSIPF